jgi:hypothetical protein
VEVFDDDAVVVTGVAVVVWMQWRVLDVRGVRRCC